MKIRTGIYGGSFNPIHLGHTGLGEWLCQQGWVDELWFLLSPLNPLKADVQQTLLGDAERLKLARLAVSQHKHLKVSDFEMHLPRPSYMVHTLEALRSTYPERQFTLIIGADNWQCFHQWKEPDEILRHHDIIVYPRQGCPIDDTQLPENVHIAVDAPLFDISSTAIRQRIPSSDYNGEWLHPDVWKRIRQKGLYALPGRTSAN